MINRVWDVCAWMLTKVEALVGRIDRVFDQQDPSESVAATAAELLQPINVEIGSAVLGMQILDNVYISPHGQEVMQRAAPGFFAVTSIALQREVFMTLARLTDPPRTGRLQNITLRTLVNALPPEIDGSLRSKLKKDLAVIEKRAAAIRDWRKKYLAHNDLAHGLGLTDPMETVSIEVVRDVVTRAGRLVETIWEMLSPEQSGIPLGASQAGGGKRLLRVLERGLEGDDGYQERD